MLFGILIGIPAGLLVGMVLMSCLGLKARADNMRMCELLHRWLDQTGNGVKDRGLLKLKRETKAQLDNG